MARYLLCPNVFVSAGATGAVVLDLARGQYLSLSSQQVASLKTVVVGWPQSQAAHEPCTNTPSAREAAQIADQLCAQGILTEDPRVGTAAATIDLALATGEFSELDPMRRPALSAGMVAHFLRACVRASLALRFRTLQQNVTMVRARKARVDSRWRSRARPDLTQLIRAFVYLRPFVYTWRGKCLFDSLVLTDFLLSYGFTPTWVFGVKMNPFAAHSWVQEGAVVLNGSAEYVQAFSPIMTI